MDNAPALTTLTTVLVIFGYLHFFLPIIFLSILCTFIPIGIVMLMALSNEPEEPRYQSVIDELRSTEYKIWHFFRGSLMRNLCHGVY